MNAHPAACDSLRRCVMAVTAIVIDWSSCGVVAVNVFSGVCNRRPGERIITRVANRPARSQAGRVGKSWTSGCFKIVTRGATTVDYIIGPVSVNSPPISRIGR